MSASSTYPQATKPTKTLKDAIMASPTPLTHDEIVAIVTAEVRAARKATQEALPSISSCTTCEMATTPELDVPQCKVPANQPIYDALLAKAASYPAEKHYKAKAYKKVAESVLTHTWDINEIAKKGTWWQGQGQHVPGCGDSIKQFITDFVRRNPY